MQHAELEVHYPHVPPPVAVVAPVAGLPVVSHPRLRVALRGGVAHVVVLHRQVTLPPLALVAVYLPLADVLLLVHRVRRRLVGRRTELPYPVALAVRPPRVLVQPVPVQRLLLQAVQHVGRVGALVVVVVRQRVVGVLVVLRHLVVLVGEVDYVVDVRDLPALPTSQARSVAGQRAAPETRDQPPSTLAAAVGSFIQSLGPRGSPATPVPVDKFPLVSGSEGNGMR